MDKNGVLGEVLEKGQSVVQKTGKAVADSASGAAKTAAGQIAGDSNGQAKDMASVSDKQIASDRAENDKLVKELYAPSQPQNGQNLPSAEPQSKTEEQAKLANVRQKLHDEVYYEPLIHGQKAKQEERPAEKVEKEKKQEMADLQQKEAKKPAPIAVQRAQQSAEKFRGVSG